LARCELAWRRKDEKTPVYHILNLAGFLWSLYFINAFGQMVLAGKYCYFKNVSIEKLKR